MGTWNETESILGLYDQVVGEIQVFESSLEACEPFQFTYDTSQYRDDNLDMGWLLVAAAPESVLETLRQWCYEPLLPNGSGVSVPENTLDLFINSTQPIYKCTDSTAIEDNVHRILTTLEYWLSSNESEVSGFMCEPRYSLTRRAVANSTRDVGVQDSLNITETIIETLDMGINPSNLTKKIMTSLFNAKSTDTQSDLPNTEWNWWFTTLNLAYPQSSLWSFRNTSLVIELSQRMWKGLAANVVKHDYTVTFNETIKGTVTSTQGRLCMQELSLRLVEAHITLLLALAVALCFSRPGVFPRDPTSLGAHSMILARSPALLGVLQGYGAASKKSLQASLSGYLASFPQHLSAEGPAVDLHQFRDYSGEIAEKPIADNSGPREWWSPVSVRWWFRICLMITILVVVISLEILLQISNHKNGLGDVSLEGYLKYTWGFLPSLVLVLVGLLFSMVDSTARTLHSFQLLRKGRATIEDMLNDPSRQVSLIAVLYAARKRQFVLFLATLPGLLAPVLTIITSGLYAVASEPWTYDTDLELTDWFRPENRTVDFYNQVKGDDGEAWTIFTLTHFSNMSYPQWTHGEYALASFGTHNLHSHDGNDTSLYITARVPATRVNMNCSLAGHYDNDSFLTFERYRNASWLPIDPRPLGCHTLPEWYQTTGQRDIYLSMQSLANLNGTMDGSRGYSIGLLEDDYHGFLSVSDHHFVEPMTSIRVCGDGRQHYFIGLGHYTEPLSVLHCVPYVEALWVNATVALPDLSLVTDVPFAPDRDSAVFLSDSASMTAFGRASLGEIVLAVVNGSSHGGQLTGAPSGPDSNYTHRLIDALESAISEYFAQVLHFNYRQPVGDNKNSVSASSAGQNLLTPDGHPATGTVTDRTRLRLKQNAISTRILQGLLGVMGACLIASTALGRGARVIPRDPGSIASRMAYFADGEVWRRVPVGADRWTDKQIKKHGLGISGGKLLLDWWRDDREDSGDGTRGKKFAVDSADREGMP